MRDSRMAWVLCCGSLLASAPPLSAGTYPTPAPAPFTIALAGPDDAPAQPHFAFDGQGNSIRVWSLGTFGPGQPLVTDVMGELVDAHGVARGPQIRLSPAPLTSNPAVAMRPDGSFAVVWRSWQQAGAGAHILGRCFDAAGAPLGNQFQINETLIPGDGMPAAAAMPDGGLLVAWDSRDLNHPELGSAVRARRLTATGAPLTAEFTASPPDNRVHWFPAVAADGFGNSAVSWDNCLLSGNLVYDCGISVLFSDPTGTPDPTLWTIRDAQGDLFDATVTAQPGGFVVGSTASAGIYGLSFVFP